MDKDEYREEVLKELREQRLFPKDIKEAIEVYGFLAVVAVMALLALVFIKFIVLFE